jgi:hypothetical protein
MRMVAVLVRRGRIGMEDDSSYIIEVVLDERDGGVVPRCLGVACQVLAT